MSELFGCCSLNEKCSDARHCLRDINDPEYSNCGYRRLNLDRGRIFYGKNANIQVETVQEEPKSVIEKPEIVIKKPKTVPHWMEPECHIYLACYNQSFKLCVRNKVGLSYGLREESFIKLKNLFDALGIPYTTELSESEQEAKEKQICNYRVTIEVGEDKYNVLNYNSLLVPEKIARGIQKAFEAKGIPAKAEQYGRYNTVEIPPWNQRVEMKVVSTEPIFEPAIEPEPESKQKEVVFEQASIFDLIGA